MGKKKFHVCVLQTYTKLYPKGAGKIEGIFATRKEAEQAKKAFTRKVGPRLAKHMGVRVRCV